MEERDLMKAMIADALDRMQECEDYIETVKLQNSLPFNDPRRDERFAKQVRDCLGCLKFRREDVTIQLKNLTQGERTGWHKDKGNCTWCGYTKTLTLSFTWVDAAGEVWSLKFVVNSRYKAGNFLDKVYKLTPMLTRMKRSMESLDHSFQNLILLQQQNGGHRYPNGLTYKTFPNLVLEDVCPWREVDLGNGVIQKQMGWTAGPVRDIHLSAPTTIVYNYHQRCGDDRKAVELAIHAAYLSGYARFYNLGSNDMERLVVESSPSRAMFRMAKEKFSDVPFGDPQVGRVSPSGVEYESVFLNEDGTINGTMGAMVDGVIGILEWINANVDDEDKFHHAGIETRVKQCIDEWKKKASDQTEEGSDAATKYLEGLAKLDFAEFRIMIAVQICCLAKVMVNGHRNLNNLVYPVGKLGAAKQLSHLKNVGERPEMINTIKREMDVDEYGTNASEGLLCETSEDRVGNIFDYVFYGQMLFIVSKEGKNLLKWFGSSEWEEF
jgi:hypothetical protein